MHAPAAEQYPGPGSSVRATSTAASRRRPSHGAVPGQARKRQLALEVTEYAAGYQTSFRKFRNHFQHMPRRLFIGMSRQQGLDTTALIQRGSIISTLYSLTVASSPDTQWSGAACEGRTGPARSPASSTGRSCRYGPPAARPCP